MSSRSTWIWLVLAAGLAAFIFLVEPQLRPLPVVLRPVLPGFDARSVTSIVIQPANGDEVRAEFGSNGWQLLKPVAYPAQAAGPVALLAALEKLMPDATLSGREVRGHTNTAAEFGLEPAQVSVTLRTEGTRHQLLFGTRTAPGDQVFLQVVGGDGINIIGADILKLLPTATNAWRDPTLLNLRALSFNRLTVTNGPTVIELQLVATNQTWQMTRPRAQRVNSERIADLVANLVKLRAQQFVTDDPAAERETLGLQPPALSVAFHLGTNLNTLLHFGKSPTNNPQWVYARRPDYPTVVAVQQELVAPWFAPVNDYRDRQLIALEQTPDRIECSGGEAITLQRQPDNSWRVEGQTFPVDRTAVAELLATLTNFTIVNFAQDVVIDPDLPKFGLAPPMREVRLFQNMSGVTNVPFVLLSFGSQPDGRTFARRADEDSVYEIARADFDRLPVSPLQLRERRVWSFTEDDVARVTTTQSGRTRTVIRQGTNSWSLAPGSQGEIFSEAIEETVHRLGELSALAWVEHGEAGPARLGFDTNSLALALELRDGTKHAVSFGGPSPGGYPCASVTLDGAPWVCEIPIGLHYLVRTHLAAPEKIR